MRMIPWEIVAVADVVERAGHYCNSEWLQIVTAVHDDDDGSLLLVAEKEPRAKLWAELP